MAPWQSLFGIAREAIAPGELDPERVLRNSALYRSAESPPRPERDFEVRADVPGADAAGFRVAVDFGKDGTERAPWPPRDGGRGRTASRDAGRPAPRRDPDAARDASRRSRATGPTRLDDEAERIDVGIVEDPASRQGTESEWLAVDRPSDDADSRDAARKREPLALEPEDAGRNEQHDEEKQDREQDQDEDQDQDQD